MYTNSVISPPATIPVVLTTLRQHCRLTHTYDDNLLTMYAQAATTMVESYTGRSLITQTLSYINTGSMPPTAIPLSTGPVLFFPLVYNAIISTPWRRIELIRSPVSAVNSVSIIQATGNQFTLDPSLYITDLNTDPAAILLTGYSLLPQDQLIINYNAGYGASPANVPVALQSAVTWLAGYMYQHRGDDDVNELPKLAKCLCDPYRISFFGSISADGR